MVVLQECFAEPTTDALLRFSLAFAACCWDAMSNTFKQQHACRLIEWLVPNKTKRTQVGVRTRTETEVSVSQSKRRVISGGATLEVTLDLSNLQNPMSMRSIGDDKNAKAYFLYSYSGRQ